MEKLIQAVRTHAENNYGSGGWDFVVECWTDNDIREVITGAKDIPEAFRMVKDIITVLDDQRSDVMAEVF